MIKIATLFLVVIVLLSFFGVLRLNRRGGRCPDCGRPRVGRGPCDCRRIGKSRA